VSAVAPEDHLDLLPVVFDQRSLPPEPELGGKWLGLLKEVAPAVKRVAVLHVPEIAPNVAFIRTAEAARLSSRGCPIRSGADMWRSWPTQVAIHRVSELRHRAWSQSAGLVLR
jgi:hypothetical protein